MKDCAIGIFDSGIGGLALVNQLNIMLPNEKVIYYSKDICIEDSSKEKEILTDYVKSSVDFLKSKKVKMIISASSDVNTLMGLKFPDVGVDFSGTFLPAAQAACGATRNNKIGIAGITSVIKKGGYARVIKNIRQGITVTGAACTKISEIAGDGIHLSESEMAESIRKDIAVVTDNKADTVIIADGISALLTERFTEILGTGIVLISPFEETARRICNDLLETDMMSEREVLPDNEIFVEGSMGVYNRLMPLFLQRKNDLTHIES